jgi:hypothetical protein
VWGRLQVSLKQDWLGYLIILMLLEPARVQYSEGVRVVASFHHLASLTRCMLPDSHRLTEINTNNSMLAPDTPPSHSMGP